MCGAGPCFQDLDPEIANLGCVGWKSEILALLRMRNILFTILADWKAGRLHGFAFEQFHPTVITAFGVGRRTAPDLTPFTICFRIQVIMFPDLSPLPASTLCVYFC